MVESYMAVSVFLTILFHSFCEYGSFLYQIISQGNEATYARCGGTVINHFIANFIENLVVKKN